MNNLYQPKSKLQLSLLFLTTALTACSIGPNYVPPVTQLVPFHNHVEISNATDKSDTPIDVWWTGFNDQELVTVVQRALNQNLDLAAAYARVNQARASASGSGARLLPTVDLEAAGNSAHQSLQGELGRIANGTPGFSRNETDTTIGPAASWEIDLFGGLRRDASAAKDEAEAAEAERAGVRITVAADTADAYLQVREYQARLDVAKNQIGNDQQLVECKRSINPIFH